MYFVYILFSKKTNRLYTGFTNNIENRLSEHNNGISKSTKSGAPWKLIFYSAFITKDNALKFEKYLKSGSGKAFKYKRLCPENLKLADPKP